MYFGFYTSRIKFRALGFIDSGSVVSWNIMAMGACDIGHFPLEEQGEGGWGLGTVTTFKSMLSVTYFFYEVFLPDIPTTLPAEN